MKFVFWFGAPESTVQARLHNSVRMCKGPGKPITIRLYHPVIGRDEQTSLQKGETKLSF